MSDIQTKYVLDSRFIHSFIDGDLILVDSNNNDEKVLRVRGDVSKMIALLDDPHSIEEIVEKLSSQLEGFAQRSNAKELVESSIEKLLSQNLIHSV